ncbi:MAG: DUF2254 domain-containing protein [Polyangiaceae bacterium]|nr:DUF2254 domain-containing protein [Polyangiaceae bacterium]
MIRVGFALQQVVHDLRVGMLLRPLVILGGSGALALAVTHAERAHPGAFAWARPLGVVDVSSAQVVLGTIAGSMLTLLALVYSVFLVAMTLVSMQFSPRGLSTLTRDPLTQTSFGMLAGTFLYALLVLRAVHGDPDAYVAPLGVALAITLAVASITTLLTFLHHISQEIQANTLIAGLADATREVLAEEFSEEPPLPTAPCPSPFAPVPDGAAAITLARSGYIQLLDVEGVLERARQAGVEIVLARAVGEYVVEGVTVGYVRGPGAAAVALAIRDDFDLGAVRTLQQDAEYGVRRIVDIGLKAISPAVNDPSTGVTCVDNLTSLLAFVATRRDPARELPAGEGKVVLARTTFARLVALAFTQLRQYAQGDMAVSLRLMRALHDLASLTREPSRTAALRAEAELLRAGISGDFGEGDRAELSRRADALLAALDRTA